MLLALAENVHRSHESIRSDCDTSFIRFCKRINVYFTFWQSGWILTWMEHVQKLRGRAKIGLFLFPANVGLINQFDHVLSYCDAWSICGVQERSPEQYVPAHLLLRCKSLHIDVCLSHLPIHFDIYDRLVLGPQRGNIQWIPSRFVALILDCFRQLLDGASGGCIVSRIELVCQL